MYGLAIGTDVAGLEGRTLEQVALGQNEVQLRLSSSASICIEGDFSVTPAGGVPTLYERPTDAAQALADLLGAAVAIAEVAEPGVLRLQLTDGTQVHVLDSNDHHESFQIRIGERLVVV